MEQRSTSKQEIDRYIEREFPEARRTSDRERGNEEDRKGQRERSLLTSIVQSVELRSVVGHESNLPADLPRAFSLRSSTWGAEKHK
jgi:hypothetical protein